ncbi:hypothetical protein AC579_1927 [Pseudocercospora musae]|uniref:Uncharacterized protein n=1 Tax=Pseudocercospora musae TaxID=113226 RepID=A0A139HFJ7_9PEZI|nr:hypothetical protein AC579_1927 [Pseudocercospora musae]
MLLARYRAAARVHSHLGGPEDGQSVASAGSQGAVDDGCETRCQGFACVEGLDDCSCDDSAVVVVVVNVTVSVVAEIWNAYAGAEVASGLAAETAAEPVTVLVSAGTIVAVGCQYALIGEFGRRVVMRFVNSIRCNADQNHQSSGCGWPAHA